MSRSPHRRLPATAILVLVALLALAPGGAAAASRQRIAVPSYFAPGPLWDQLVAGAPTVGLTVINPASGPGATPDPRYAAQVARAQAAGIAVLGYVHTGYGERPASDALAEIERFYAWYGVDGIFLDEASTDCARLAYYDTLRADIKARGGAALVVLNPGTQTSECYMAVASIVVSFENSYAAYNGGYAAPAWVQRYPADRFWHLVHAAGTVEQMRRAVTLSRQRGAGWVYVTPDTLPNPWDTLPTKQYWTSELAAVR